MASERERFRLLQEGYPVAWTDGPTALNEISHYAAVYGRDAPVMIEQHVKGKWRKFK